MNIQLSIGTVQKLIALLIIASLASGCVSKGSPKTRQLKTNIPVQEIIPDDKFYLDAGDQISIKFFYNSELNEDLLNILPDGTISLQLVGSIVAKGKSVTELTNELIDSYKKVIARPEITVQVKTIRERWVFVGGEVRQPGQYQDRNGLNPLQAIFLAGGFKSAASVRNILILRKMANNELGYYTYDLKKNFSNLNSFDNFKLRDSDIIFVSRTPIGNINEFISLYVSGLLPSWFQVFLTDNVDEVRSQ